VNRSAAADLDAGNFGMEVCMSVFRHLDKEFVTALSEQLGAGHHRF
jgi:hypothetical protein